MTTAPITNNSLLPTGLGSGLGNAAVSHAAVLHRPWPGAALGAGAAGHQLRLPRQPDQRGRHGQRHRRQRRHQHLGPDRLRAADQLAGQLRQVRLHRPGRPGDLSALPRARHQQHAAAQLAGASTCSRRTSARTRPRSTTSRSSRRSPTTSSSRPAGIASNFTTVQHNYLGGNVGNAVEIDPNTRLLNGAPNPYFGRAYTVSQQGDDIYLSDLNEQERISLAYTLDFTKNDNWTKWLGHHNLLAFYQHRENDTNSYRYREEVLDAHSWNSTTDIGNNASGPSGSINQRFYLSNAGAAVSYAPGTFINSAFTYPVTWYNTQLNGGTWTNENAKLAPDHLPGLDVQGAAAGLELFRQPAGLPAQRRPGPHLRPAPRLRARPHHRRRDRRPGHRPDRRGQSPVLEHANGLAGGWNLSDGITRQAGGVLHIPAKWLSVHYNQSDNFQVAGLGEDQFGNVLPNPTGTARTTASPCRSLTTSSWPR